MAVGTPETLCTNCLQQVAKLGGDSFSTIFSTGNSDVSIAGLDLVEVIRELPAFTAGYAYCLVTNTFLQRADGEVYLLCEPMQK